MQVCSCAGRFWRPLQAQHCALSTRAVAAQGRVARGWPGGRQSGSGAGRLTRWRRRTGSRAASAARGGRARSGAAVGGPGCLLGPSGGCAGGYRGPGGKPSRSGGSWRRGRSRGVGSSSAAGPVRAAPRVSGMLLCCAAAVGWTAVVLSDSLEATNRAGAAARPTGVHSHMLPTKLSCH